MVADLPITPVMVLPVVHEISHDRAAALRLEWRRALAEQAKALEAAAAKAGTVRR